MIFLCTSTKKSSVTKWQTTGRKALLLSQTELLKSINAKGKAIFKFFIFLSHEFQFQEIFIFLFIFSLKYRFLAFGQGPGSFKKKP